MLLGPSAVLYLVSGRNILKLLLIGAFTVLFSAALHAFSKARRHENFAATSAYVSQIYQAFSSIPSVPWFAEWGNHTLFPEHETLCIEAVL